jgi:hypothetical protein
MERKLEIACFLMLTAALVTGCNRKDKQPLAGKGGNTTLRMTPMHHSVNIDSCTVYIRYNATDASSSYNDSAKCIAVGGKPVAVFPQLKKGKYYIFGQGWDGTISRAVRGGIPYEITLDGSLDLILPVTETGH